MKNIEEIKDYRIKYKRYYNVEFDHNYVIHHIDFDRENHDISNLLLLPRDLHNKYHAIVNAITISAQKPKADGMIDVRISNVLITDYGSKMFDLLPEVIAECSKWLKWRNANYEEYFRKILFE